MPFLALKDIAEKTPVPGFHARFVHSVAMTVAHWRVEAGAILPEHTHVHEMIVNMLEGELELTVGDETNVIRAGDVVVIPSHVPHSGKAITDCRILDVFHPVREDYR
jgi:quercetin dioxygenase-like cupin family protein